MKVNQEYTNNDHETRETDVYALAKYKWTLRELRKSRIPKTALVANLGCGSGTFTTMLAEDGFSVYGAEPDKTPFLTALKRLPQGCTVENKGIFEIDGDNRFDVIIMHDVLEHIEDDVAAIEKIRLLLKPDGLAILSVSALQSLFGQHDIQLGHFRRYSKKSLKKVLDSHLQLETTRYFGFLSIPIVLIFSKLLKRDYPEVSADKISALGKTYSLICNLESRIWEPSGTSLLVIARNS